MGVGPIPPTPSYQIFPLDNLSLLCYNDVAMLGILDGGSLWRKRCW